MQEIAIILSSLAGVATAAIVRRIPKEKNQAAKTTINTHVRNQITSLKVERDILNKIITRLYKDSPDITNNQKDKLLAKYQYQLKIVTEKLDRLEQARDHPDFNLVGDSLAALMDKKLSKLDDRLDEISAKMQTAKQELPGTKQHDITKTAESSLEKTQELKDGISEESKVSIGQKEPTLTKKSVSQSKNIETKVGTAVTAVAGDTAPVLPKVDRQTEVGTAVTAVAAPVLPKVDRQTEVGTAVTAVAAPVLPKVDRQTEVGTAVTAVAAPVLPKVDRQTEVGVLSETSTTKKSTLAVSESVQTGKLPIEKKIDRKVPIQNTEDKIQIMQTMVQKPENPLEKTRTSIAMPKPVTVMDPDRAGTGSKLPLEEKSVTTDVEFDDGDDVGDDVDMQDLDEIKKDIVKIMTKLDQAEVE